MEDTSELATNAILHVRLAFELWVDPSPPCVRVSVEDLSDPLPMPVERARDDEVTGRGLWMIETTSDRWGVEPTDLGKRIWFEVCPAGS